MSSGNGLRTAIVRAFAECGEAVAAALESETRLASAARFDGDASGVRVLSEEDVRAVRRELRAKLGVVGRK